MRDATPQVTIRLATPKDYSFIFATYLRNRWYSPSNTTTLQKSHWMKAQHARLEGMLAAQPVLVACDGSDADVIYGYRLRDGSEDYSYVKLAFRLKPVLQALAEATYPTEVKGEAT